MDLIHLKTTTIVLMRKCTLTKQEDLLSLVLSLNIYSKRCHIKQ